MAIGTREDVETSLMRELTSEEEKYIGALLERAENLIRVRIPNLSDRSAQEPDFSSLVAQVEAEAVARVLRAENSGIYKSESEDGYSYQLNMMVASGLLDILPAEWERLTGSGGLKMVAPATDGYAARRLGGVRPDLAFQYVFPAPQHLNAHWW